MMQRMWQMRDPVARKLEFSANGEAEGLRLVTVQSKKIELWRHV
jgi:hypothetical protein